MVNASKVIARDIVIKSNSPEEVRSGLGSKFMPNIEAIKFKGIRTTEKTVSVFMMLFIL